MSNPVSIDGTWPAPVRLSRGWAKATARQWNDETTDGFLRLERGGLDFLTVSTETIAKVSGSAVYSPALYPSATRIWAKAGYDPYGELEIWERSVDPEPGPVATSITEVGEPAWDRLIEIDRSAFEGFWRMSGDGLQEAFASTKRSAVLESRSGAVVTGYAIVGAQWDVAYIQRIAVHPDHSGQGIGADLVRHAVRWGKATRSRVMVLNVRRENERARRLYAREGFTSATTSLRILRYGT